MKNNPLNNLMQAEMDRKEFLARSGAMLAVVVGASGIIKALTGSNTRRSSGYGTSPYGGGREASRRQR